MKVSIVSAGARQRFCTPLGAPWFCSAARTCSLVLHTLRTFMSTHVLELFKNMCGHKCSQGVADMLAALQNSRNRAVWKTSAALALNFANKTAPVLGSRNGPQNGGHSLSLNLICLCPGGFGVRFWTQNGGRFCRRN